MNEIQLPTMIEKNCDKDNTFFISQLYTPPFAPGKQQAQSGLHNKKNPSNYINTTVKTIKPH